MRICVAQTRPVKGDIPSNIAGHERLIDLAGGNAADIIIFPELSLTGYEPRLADELAANENDPRFDSFQRASNENTITIGVGIPTRNSFGVCISLVLFQPHQPRAIYSKMFLHSDENAYFVSGDRTPGLIGNGDCALAICYELSVPEHAARASADGARVYIASVAKPVDGVAKALDQLAEISRDYSMTVLMANSVGVADGFQYAGKSSVWNRNGELLSQLDDANEGVIILDTEILDVKAIQLPECH